ncbi:MAG TPA: hypothetical protein VFI79_05890 [Gemmatimonadales bacterium]|nr:hypothetical protein [Gemmatimonadales bacterium]
MHPFGLVALRPKRTRRRDGQRSSFVLLFLLTLAGVGSAQVIPIRTVPLSEGDQFLVYPSNNLGMGGVSVALPDSLLDPFRNPAMGARLGQARLFGSPALYSTTQQTGNGVTLPLAAFGRARSWFGGISLVVQQVDGSRAPPFVGIAIDPPINRGPFIPSGPAPDFGSHGNQYAFASLGKILSGGGLSIGGSVQWSRLRALDGSDLLFPGRQQMSESGRGLDLRLGLLKDWSGNRSFEALLLHDRFRMSEDVTYLDTFWDPGTQQFVQTERIERALDRTVTTGVHVAYQRPLAASGWRIGWLGTLNLVSEPRISENEIVTLPRDEGRATAADIGVGFSKTRGPGTFAIDLLYEPIWSSTWGVAQAPIATARGDTLAAGERTVTNRFRFSNLVLRLGVNREMTLVQLEKAVGLQLGLALRSVSYQLNQTDRVATTQQHTHSSWVEWTPTWGLSLRFPEFELRYRGRVTNGMGRPAQAFAPVGVFPAADVAPGVFVVAPDATLHLMGVSTITHQVSLSLPLD